MERKKEVGSGGRVSSFLLVVFFLKFLPVGFNNYLGSEGVDLRSVSKESEKKNISKDGICRSVIANGLPSRGQSKMVLGAGGQAAGHCKDSLAQQRPAGKALHA